jgi:hypothetical protein
VERELELDIDESKAEYTQSFQYLAVCETCGWSGDSTEDRNTAVMEEWAHIREYTIGVEHQVKLHCYLITTRIDDLTGMVS